MNTRLGLAGVVGGVFSNLANAANAILSSPSKLGTFFIKKKSFSKLHTLLVRKLFFFNRHMTATIWVSHAAVTTLLTISILFAMSHTRSIERFYNKFR